MFTDAVGARALLDQFAEKLRDAGVRDFRAPPLEPTTCCGRGCNGCVWEGYFAAAQLWCDDAEALLTRAAA